MYVGGKGEEGVWPALGIGFPQCEQKIDAGFNVAPQFGQ